MTEEQARREADSRLKDGAWGAVAVESPVHSGNWIVETKVVDSVTAAGFPHHPQHPKAKGSVS